MTKPAIYIDDTGTPQKSKSKYDCGNWESYVAVLLKPNERKEITKLILELKKIVNKSIKVDEFHFTEIFSGTKQFKGVALEIRLEIFNSFIEIYRMYDCPIVIQSITDDDVIRNKMEYIRGYKNYGFDFDKNSHLCLWLLLVRIVNNDIIKNYNLPFEIFVDAGKQKPNTVQKIEQIKNITENSEIRYIDSAVDPLMQFVDFIAFTLNRCRWILMNDLKSQGDKAILKIAEYANFNAINMERRYVNVDEESTKDQYEKVLRRRYDINGNLSDEEMEQIKKNRE